MKQHNSLSLVLQRRESLLSPRGFRRILSLIGFETRWKTVWPARRSLEDWANRLEKEEEEGRLAGRRREGAAPRRARMSASIHPCGRRCTTHPAASHDASTMPRPGYFELHAQVTRFTGFVRSVSETFWTEFDRNGSLLNGETRVRSHFGLMIRIRESRWFFFSVGNK